jgi:hypothetical protein
MRWVLRFLAWATPLTWLATTVYSPYVRVLARVATLLFTMVGIGIHVESVEILAPVELALFAALALSSFATPWPARLARLALGLGILFVLEVVTVVGGAILFLMLDLPPGSPLLLFTQNVVGLMAWAGAPVAWILLFRPRQLLRTITPLTGTWNGPGAEPGGTTGRPATPQELRAGRSVESARDFRPR